MRKRQVFSTVLVCVYPVIARAAFATCEDARNYGDNSSRLLIAQTFTRVACDASLMPSVHRALDRAISLQVLRTKDPDPIKLCYYDGYWDGLESQLELEYARCADVDGFICVPRDVTEAHAGSLLRAMSRALSDPTEPELYDWLALFSHEPPAQGVTACVPLELAACTEAITSTMDPLSLAIYASDLEAIAMPLCED